MSQQFPYSGGEAFEQKVQDWVEILMLAMILLKRLWQCKRWRMVLNIQYRNVAQEPNTMRYDVLGGENLPGILLSNWLSVSQRSKCEPPKFDRVLARVHRLRRDC